MKSASFIRFFSFCCVLVSRYLQQTLPVTKKQNERKRRSEEERKREGGGGDNDINREREGKRKSHRFTSRQTIVTPDFGLTSRQRDCDLFRDPEGAHPPIPACAHCRVQKLFAIQLLPMFLILKIARL